MFNQHLHQQQWWRQPRSQRSSQFTDKFGRRKPKLTFQIFVLPFTRYSLDFLFSVNTSAFRWALWRMFQVFGGLVWILVASTHVIPPNPLGWVMFVSVFCFVMTFLWMIIFTAGCHKNSASWAAAVRPGSRWVGPKAEAENHTDHVIVFCLCPGLCLSRTGSVFLPERRSDLGFYHPAEERSQPISKLPDRHRRRGENWRFNP